MLVCREARRSRCHTRDITSCDPQREYPGSFRCKMLKAAGGSIGHRWGRHFVMVDAELRRAASVSVGDVIDVVVEPTESRKALAIAREQAKLTTAPGRKAKR